MSKKEKEDDNRKVAWVVSITLHVLLLLAFIFMIAWREPNPPYPEYGIEVNFGTSSVGSGDVQPTEPVNNSESEEEAQPEDTSAEEIVEDIVEQIVEANESSSVQETEVVTQTAESPDVINEQPKQETNQPIEKPVKEEVIEEKPPVEEVKPQKVKTPVVYKKKDGADGKSGESNTPKNANHGDDVDATGDKGNEEGTLDARTLYGNKGGG
ncbi:MAG: hypothetical protein OEW67_06035, partial [Cyclobacteriaceae bacterium]|nr:hypothetical protein [Cyclobacteriaceae bacterium]